MQMNGWQQMSPPLMCFPRCRKAPNTFWKHFTTFWVNLLPCHFPFQMLGPPSPSAPFWATRRNNPFRVLVKRDECPGERCQVVVPKPRGKGSEGRGLVAAELAHVFPIFQLQFTAKCVALTPRLTLEGIKQFFVAVEREQLLGRIHLLKVGPCPDLQPLNLQLCPKN